MAGLDANRGAKRAREARERLRLDEREPVPCLLTAVERRAGFPVVVRRMPEEVAGACVRHGSDRLLWVNGAHHISRQRFTLAHELGHAWCHHDGAATLDTIATLSGGTTNAHEIQANAFAAEFLLPRAALPGLVEDEPTLEELVVIAAAYGVSAWVVLFSLQGARLVGDERAARLRGELEDGLHEELRRQLDPPALEDRLSSLDELPYLSPRLRDTALGGVLAGTVSIVAAAGAASIDQAALQAAVEAF